MKRYIPTKPEPENKPMQSATQAAVLAPPWRQNYSNLGAQTGAYASLPQAHATRLQNLASGGGARDMTGSRKYVPHAGVRSARAMWYTPRLDLTNRTSSAVPKVSGLVGRSHSMSESTIGIPVDEATGCSEDWAVREMLSTLHREWRRRSSWGRSRNRSP